MASKSFNTSFLSKTVDLQIIVIFSLSISLRKLHFMQTIYQLCSVCTHRENLYHGKMGEVDNFDKNRFFLNKIHFLSRLIFEVKIRRKLIPQFEKSWGLKTLDENK